MDDRPGSSVPAGMTRRVLIPFLVLLLALTGSAYGGCTENPVASNFVVTNTCSFEHPCLEDQPLTLTIEVYGCLHSWDPCKPFTFTSCDTVSWDFGDGQFAVGTGSAKVTHTWANPGTYAVRTVVNNPNGLREMTHTISIARNPPAFVTWAADDYQATESDGSVTLTLTRSGDTSRALNLLLSAGSAPFGPPTAWDRTIESIQDRPLTMAAGVTSMPVTVLLRGDDVYLGPQTYLVSVHEANGEAVLPGYNNRTAAAFVHVADDDPAPVLTVHDVTIDEGDGRQVIKIPHVLSQPLPKDFSMLWWSAGGTATPRVDWDSPLGGVYFPAQAMEAGHTTLDLEVVILGDTKAEGDETIVLDIITGPAPVVLSQQQITITIRDDDEAAPPPPPPPPPPTPEPEPTPEPRITSLTPATGPVTGGTTVAIAGEDLFADCTVTFGGTPAASVTWRNEHSMTAVTPHHDAGTVDVRLTCGALSSTMEQGYRYTATKRRAAR